MSDKLSIPDNKTLIELIDQNILKIVLFGFIFIASVTLIILYVLKEPASEINLYTIAKQDLHVTIKESAVIQSVENRNISLKAPPRPPVTSIQVTTGPATTPTEKPEIIYLSPEGTIAQPGDTLIKFDPVDLLLERQQYINYLNFDLQTMATRRNTMETEEIQAERKLESAKFTIESKRLELESARFSSENVKLQKKMELEIAFLDSIDTISEIENQRALRRNEILQTQLLIDDDRANIKRLENRINEYTVIADYNALVSYSTNSETSQKFKIGDTATLNRTILKLPDFSRFSAVILVNDLDRQKVWVDQEATVRLEAYPQSLYPGKVTDLSLISQNPGSQMGMMGMGIIIFSSNQQSNIKVFSITVMIENIDQTEKKMRPGMTAQIELSVNRLIDVIVVPLSAVFEYDGRPHVFVSNNGEQKLREIELGKRNEILAEVLSGLQEGEKVLKQPDILFAEKLGNANELQKRKEKIAIQNQQFGILEELGIGFDYDKARAEQPDKNKSPKDALPGTEKN